MFYLDSDKKEIHGWIKRSDDDLLIKVREEIQRQLGNLVTAQQLSQYDAEFKSQIDVYLKGELSTLQRDITAIKMASVSASEVSALKADVSTIRQELNALKSLSSEISTLKTDVSELLKKLSTLKTPLEVQTLQAEVSALKQTIDALKAQPEVQTLQAEVSALKQTIDALKAQPEVQTLQAEVSALKQTIDALKAQPEVQTLQTEVSALKQTIDALKAPPEVQTLQAEVSALKQTIDTLKTPPEVQTLQKDVSALKQTIDALKTPPEVQTLQAEVSALKQTIDTLKAQPEVQTLQAEVSALKQTIDALKTPPEVQTLQAEVSALKQTIDTLKTPPTVQTPYKSPEELFFLPEPKGVFITNERTKIPAQIKQALNVSGIEKYLAANPSDASKKFQRLLNSHSRDVKKFVDKLRLSEPDESELSEVITTKYFKLFHRTIFDNLLVAIRRGLKGSEKFYVGLLAEVNKYLSCCGIYSVNMKSGKQAEAEDYENITPQIVKTDDQSLSGTISEVERLPYRINYLDEFGEQKFLQYAGVASLYKAV